MDDETRRLWRYAMELLPEVQAWMERFLTDAWGRPVQLAALQPAHEDLTRAALRFLDTEVVHRAQLDGVETLLPMILVRRPPGADFVDRVGLFIAVAEAWHLGRGEAMPAVFPLVFDIGGEDDHAGQVMFAVCSDGDDDIDLAAEPTDESFDLPN